MGSLLSVPCRHDNEKNHVEEAREISYDLVVPARNSFPLTPDLKGFLDTKELGNSGEEAIPAQPKPNSMASLSDDRTLIVEKKVERYKSEKEKKQASECEEEESCIDVSTELVLSLYDPYKIKKKLKQSSPGQLKRKSTASLTDDRTSIVEKKVKRCRSRKEKKEASECEEDESCTDVSTELVLSLYDPYKIKKKLKQSNPSLRGKVHSPPSMGSSLCVSCLINNEKNHVEEAGEILPDVVVPARNFFLLTTDPKDFLDTKELGNPHQEAIPVQPKRKSADSLSDDRTLIMEKKLKRYRSQKEKKEALECEEEDRCNGVSTELVLSLYDPYKIKKLKQSGPGQLNRKSMASLSDDRTSIVEKKVKRYRSRKEKKEASECEEEEKCTGVSTELVLRLYDPYTIKKKLTQSDLGNLSRLLIGQDLVKSHLLRWMSEETASQVNSKGANVIMRDVDTCSEHQLVFINWASSGSYVLKGGWPKEFVKRRGLAVGDEIGIYWDSSTSKFYFSLLHKAN